MRRFLMVLAVMVMIPYVTTLAWTGKLDGSSAAGRNNQKEKNLEIRMSEMVTESKRESDDQNGVENRIVIVTRNDRDQKLSVEDFLIHVLAAQIPAEFGPETLKAQAVLARTYIYSLMDGRSEIYEEELDMDALSFSQMEQLWGEKEYAKNLGKLQEAVRDTAGLYLIYDGEYMEPLFCYASAGKTRSKGDAYPYLREAESPGDLLAENYRSLPVFSIREFADRISSIPGSVQVEESRLPEEIQIVERDSAGYVMQVQIGQKTYTGEEVQYALGLASPCYSFERLDGKIRVICKGVGHGYGFSQFGANEMEKEGKTYPELLEHYFQNVDLVQIE